MYIVRCQSLQGTNELGDILLFGLKVLRLYNCTLVVVKAFELGIELSDIDILYCLCIRFIVFIVGECVVRLLA